MCWLAYFKAGIPRIEDRFYKMEKNNMKKNKQFHLVQTLEFHGFYILFFSQCLTNHVHILVVQSICSEFKETAASVIYIYIV